MHLALIDQLANNGNSPLHRAKPISKIILSMFILISIIITDSLGKLFSLMAMMLVLYIAAGIPLKKTGHLILYPLFFSLLFAIVKMHDSLAAGIVVIMKAVNAALAMLLLISTTSYIEVFCFFSLFMPKILVDIMIFTYRSLFILIDKIENMIKIIKLRGGYHPFNLLLNLKNMAGAVGVLMIHSFDMSERMYRIYSLRGYGGRINMMWNWRPLEAVDIIIIMLSIFILTGMVIL